jgi:hypothetical protein
MVFNATFNNISVIMAVSFIGGGNRCAQRKPPTYRKSLANYSHNVASSTSCLSRIRTHNVSCLTLLCLASSNFSYNFNFRLVHLFRERVYWSQIKGCLFLWTHFMVNVRGQCTKIVEIFSSYFNRVYSCHVVYIFSMVPEVDFVVFFYFQNKFEAWAKNLQIKIILKQ